MASKELISVKNFSFKLTDTTMFSDVSFKVNSGDCVLFEGRNGAGKSTLLKLLLGLVDTKRHSVAGDIIIAGESVINLDSKGKTELRSKIAYLEQKDSYEAFYGITVREVLEDSYEAYLNHKLNREEKKYVEKVFYDYVPEKASIKLNSKINKLSGGQQRLVSIVSSLCLRENAEIFIIDEPLNNLDINTIVFVSNILNGIRLSKSEAAMIIVSHCKIFPFINRVLELSEGRIVEVDTIDSCHTCFGHPDMNGYYS